MSVFVDADDNIVWDIENSLEAERYLLTQENDHAQAISERDDVAQNVEEAHGQGGPVIIEELHDRMVPAQGNDVREVELLHRQKQEVTIGSNEVAELHEQSKRLMIEQDNAMRKVKFLEEQKKLIMTELNFSIKDVVELQNQKNAVAAERDSALGEMKTFREKAEQVKTEQDNLVREIEVLRKEKHEITTKLDHAVLEAVEARKQKMLMMADRDCALQTTEGLRTLLEQIISEGDKAVREMAELHGQEVQPLPTSQFTPEELQNAISDGIKVGRGGFGVVYKGFLRNTTVAIKMLSSTGVQGQSEFKQEVYTHLPVIFPLDTVHVLY